MLLEKQARRRRERMALDPIQTNNNLLPQQNVLNNREEEIKKENYIKLDMIFKNELRPNPYDNKLNEYGNNCTICLEIFKNGSEIVKLFCKHLFHANCFKKWCIKGILNPKCPNSNF